VTAPPTPLVAGPVRCVLDGADIRDLRVGEQRVLTRLYIAVRDEVWNTIPFKCETTDLQTGAEGFKVDLSCAVDQPPIRAEWVITIGGSAAGEFSYAIRGQALANYRFAKLGLNLHHPLPENLGAAYVARRGDKVLTGKIPGLIEPQFFVNGKLTGMFMPYDELVLQSAADDEVVFRFSGDEFEMQDHRNWTDYNLKSYGTPLEVPLPLVAEPGQPIDQSVVIDVRKARGFREALPKPMGQSPARQARGRAAIDRVGLARLPRIGSEFPDEVADLDPRVASLVGSISLHYVRLTLDLTSDEAVQGATAKARQIFRWGRPIELVLVVSRGEPLTAEVARLDDWLQDLRPPLERVVVLEGPRGFSIGRMTTAGNKVRAYREIVENWCGPTALVSATEQSFAELNRWWPDLAGVDGVGYTICPQVHASDDISVMENSWGQSDTVTTARARSGGRAVHVTSVAMIGKFGPYPAGVPEVPLLSAYGDDRQGLLFGAAWALSSLRQLVDAEAASATYFELSGARGLVGTPGDATSTDPVPVPVYRVLEAVLSWVDANLVRVGAVHGEVVGLGAEWPDRSELLIANLGQDEQRIELSGLSGRLTEVAELSRGSSRGAEWTQVVPPAANTLKPGAEELTLAPYGVTRVRTA
jgi:D-apionolactonase